MIDSSCFAQQPLQVSAHSLPDSGAPQTLPHTPRLRLRVRPTQHAAHRCGVCCSTVRKDGSAETRGLRPVDASQPTLREQFHLQQREQQSACRRLVGAA